MLLKYIKKFIIYLIVFLYIFSIFIMNNINCYFINRIYSKIKYYYIIIKNNNINNYYILYN